MSKLTPLRVWLDSASDADFKGALTSKAPTHMVVASLYIVYTSRFVRVVLAQRPC